MIDVGIILYFSGESTYEEDVKYISEKHQKIVYYHPVIFQYYIIQDKGNYLMTKVFPSKRKASVLL